MSARKKHRARIVLLVSLLVTAVLYSVPQLEIAAYPFMLLSTVAHELGHGFTAILIGGRFDRFEMWSDGSGVAHVASPASRLGQALVAAGGLVGPAVAAALGFLLGRTARGARQALMGLALLLLIAQVLFVRGFFGFFFVAFIILACGVIAWKTSDDLAQLFLVFLALQLALSVFSRGDYLFTPTAETSGGTMPSDVGQIAAALFLPYWVWGALCAAVSIAVLALGVKAFWQR